MPRPRPDVPPEQPRPSVEELRRSLVRKLDMIMADWRRCPRRVCRRLRVCTPADDDFCAGPEPSRPPMTDEEWDKAKADLRRRLAQRLAELRGQRQ